MSKIIFLFIFFIIASSCSLNKNSKFWTTSKNIDEEKELIYNEIVFKEDAIEKEFNPNLKIKLDFNIDTNKTQNNNLNNNSRSKYDGTLKKSSRFKFSKIDDFYNFEPTISFNNKKLIFFDNKGSIFQFNEKSKLIWKKNYYSKLEKKQKPILQFANNGKFLVVADNIAKYYMLNLGNGDLIWSKNNLAPFNSQIKIYNDKFFIVDFSNTLRCFSIKNGDELWNVKTENSLIRSKKKLSLVIVDGIVYFSNTLGDVSAVDITSGELLWQLPTQSSLIYEAAFSLETSDLVADKNTIFFSNNKNQFFSIDLGSGSFNWENKINSNLRPSIVGNYIFTVSIEGYLFVVEKNSGNIVRVTDIFKNFKPKKRKKIKPTGFVIGLNNIYLSTDNGRLLVVEINSGVTKSILKIDKEKISRPIIHDQNLFVVKDNAIIRLN